MEPPRSSNDDQTPYQAQYWNGPESSHWLVHEHRYEPMLAAFTRLVLGAAAVARTDRVLDVGCGTGSTTCTAARDTDDGHALGVDISRPLLLGAGQRARQEGLTNVGFEHGDAQTHRLAPGGFDVAISRFGVMVFSDPTAAFANIARGLGPGGRLVLVCWQGLVDNEWITVPAGAAAQHLPLPSLTEPGSPAPLSLSDRHHLAAVLDAAGFVEVAIEPVAEPLWLGRDVADTVECFTASERDPRGDQPAGDDRSGAPVRSPPRRREATWRDGLWRTARPTRHPLHRPSLDLTKHGQVPKLCRRTR